MVSSFEESNAETEGQVKAGEVKGRPGKVGDGHTQKRKRKKQMNKFMGHKMKRKTKGCKRGPESSAENLYCLDTGDALKSRGGKIQLSIIGSDLIAMVTQEWEILIRP